MFPTPSVTTVVSEWLGGFEGLGVYMIQSKKLFQYDTMFAIIILVSSYQPSGYEVGRYQREICY